MSRHPRPVALDGFGVERGFDLLAEGARMAADDGVPVRVFGPPPDLGGLDGHDLIELIPADRAVTNSEDPVASVRGRPDASVVRAVDDVAAGRAGSVVSLGSTGALMAAATFGIKRLRGVKRPALAAELPVPGRRVIFLDVGANAEVRAQHLVQFAFMGAAFSKAVRGVERPQVALLSVGEEAGKGTRTVVEAGRVLGEAAGIEFIGNVEGRDLPRGAADVVVTDGFTGNVSLKLMEGTAKVVAGAVSDAARSNPVSALGGLMLRPALSGLRSEMSPDSHGGAILLGLRGVAVVGHGNSGAEGVANAVRLASRCAEMEAPRLTGEMMREAGVNRGAMAPAGQA